MADLKARTEKLGAAKVEGKDLYFGTTKVDNSVVDAVAKDDGVAATIFVKSGDEYVRVATTLMREDGTSAVGTALDPRAPLLQGSIMVKLTMAMPRFLASRTSLNMSQSRTHPVRSSGRPLSASQSEL